jgi:hypothetical protein
VFIADDTSGEGVKMSQEMSLGDFIKELAALLHKRGVSMPFKNQRPWHLVLYDLKTAPSAVGRPAFLDQLTFDWDGPYPKSRELSEFLHALHWNASVSVINPHYETITLTNEVAELWLNRYEQQLDPDTRTFLSAAAESAQKEFSKALDATRASETAGAAR